MIHTQNILCTSKDFEKKHANIYIIGIQQSDLNDQHFLPMQLGLII